ncbi:MAG: hypothetical protein PHD15_06810 [Clostridia bacterium]|nr:hypothetical protein [Clostridia bacterium]MDD4387439.1 hypothetical protein [Clostridia bacterium]
MKKTVYTMLLLLNGLGLKLSLGANAGTRTKSKDIFVLDTNDYVVYINNAYNVYPDGDADIAIEPVGPIYTEDNLPSEYIPIFTIEQFNNISSGQTNYQILNKSGVSKGNYNMVSNATYVLMNDLDFSSISNQVPIKGFTGTLEGNRYTVKNITMDTTTSTTSYVSVISGLEIDPPGGLFDRVTNGFIQNLTIDRMNLTGVGSLGALMGENTGTTITSCKVINSNITSNVAPIYGYKGSAGGLIGFVNNLPITITKSKVISTKILGDNSSGMIATSFGDITITSSRVESVTAEYAGFIGYNDAELTMTSCKSIKTVAPVGMVYISTGDTTFTNCESSNIQAVISGMVYLSEGKFTATNCKVLNSTITSDYDDIGGIISAANSDTEFTGCEVNKTKITSGSGAAIGGLVAVSNESTKIVNSNFIDSSITGGYHVGGIVGITWDLDIDNCKVEKFSLNSTGINAGIVSLVNGSSTINNCSVNNMEVTDSTYITAGIIALSCYDGATSISNCNVQDLKLNNSSDTTAGIIAISSHTLLINNCSVSNSNLITSSYGHAGGIVAIARKDWDLPTANLSITNSSVKSTTLSGSEIGGIISIAGHSNLTIDKCSVSDLKILGETFVIGGIVGIEDNDNGNTSITDCTVNDFIMNENGETCDGETTYGGIIALAKNTLTIDKCSVTNATLLSYGSYAGQAGGIVAVASKDWDSPTVNLSITNCNVKGSTISSLELGGIVAILSFDTAIINTCNIETTNIISNSTSTDYQTIVGGIAGVGKAEISNCNITDSNIESSTFVAGGIAGIGHTIKITDSNITRSKVTAGEMVGGIIGILDSENPSDHKIQNCKVINSIITNLHYDNYPECFTGGIAGIAESPIISCSVTGSTILSNNINSEYAKVGGISGISSATPITSCSVSDSTITSKSANIGGISGFGFNISSCTVTNATITDTNTSSITTPITEFIQLNGLGGIVGHGNNYDSSAIITNCKVINSTLNGCDAVGGMSGAASPRIVDSEVTGTRVAGTGKFIGGIQGFGGSLGENTLAVTINNCKVKNSQLVGISNVNYILGLGSYYPADSTVPVGSRLTDLLTNCTYENTTIN